ncbi:MAG: Gfo/Idh/MocA family protein [Tepidisphaerales bacterium]
MIRIGIIGAGPMAAAHASYFAGQGGRCRVAAVADVDAERAKSLSDKCGARAVHDYHAFLPDVDAVVIASPNFLHKEQAVECARAGKHVYCEKPMGLSLAEATEIDAAIRAAGVKSQVGFAVRFDPTIQTMARLAREGRFGALVSVASRRLMWMDPAKVAGWRKDPALSGGLLMEINIHEIEWMMHVGGTVESVYARVYRRTPHPRANDHLFVTMTFAGGATGFHEGSWMAATPMYWRQVMGTEGGAYTNEWGNQLYVARAGENRQETTPDGAFDVRGDFLKAIETGGATTADSTYALRVMAVAEAILESGQTGQPVRPALG